ncbi:hypothetical protein HOY34_16790 [Xinfangfangia sp. D13-10-4-6]|uniref:hypothetical protein n=1 Tax=Pseudogemmobacter hezensis TaxID=2737662 RepID=UPI001555DC51|nr:hypothetical protein [Pseudogemmobacter hezensis]NPD16852.1 hypothetical protein [Pseudogemmobacter hezensis]
MKTHLTAIARLVLACLVLGCLSPGLAQAGPKDEISSSLRADVTHQGQNALIEVTSQAGWVCSGRAKIPEQSKKSGGKSAGKSGGKSGSGKAASLRLKCSDGSTARAEVKRDADRREWSIAFRHKEHGRADLRAREN